MCRNIKTLFNFDPPVTDEEIRAASLQFVRKITGFNKPSKANEAAFWPPSMKSPACRLACSIRSIRTPRRRIGKKKPPRPELAPRRDLALEGLTLQSLKTDTARDPRSRKARDLGHPGPTKGSASR